MKKWTNPVVAEIGVEETADIKPPCYTASKKGTCTYWCQGFAGGRPVCTYNGGYCKKEGITGGSGDSNDIVGGLS